MKAKRLVVTVVLEMIVLVLVTGYALLNSPPVASFTQTPSSGEAPLVVSFDASDSYDSDGSITLYAWSFGDDRNGSGVTASHIYNSAGTYAAQLTVTDNDGSTDTASRSITVIEPAPPSARIEITEFTQYSDGQGYVSRVYVYYKITNTGSVDIGAYKMWIEVTCIDGSTYQEQKNAVTDIPAGTYVSDYAVINVANKQAISATITQYELTSEP
ncbi:MAG: PKD domain-containing protein [Nitrospiraceae bacterium]|nr:PKD domain-containing protein [Nitrospiraceae bacterium]